MTRIPTLTYISLLIATTTPFTSKAACRDGVVGHVTHPNGCREQLVCNSGEWVPLGCSGTIACTGCNGKSGTQSCSSSCEVTGCKVGLELCNNCDDDGDGVIDNSPNTPSAHSLTEACNPNACSTGGARTCTPTGWGMCNGCAGTATCTGCNNRAGTRACDSTCTTPSPCNVGMEVCNNCDDNGNGEIDENITRNTCYSTAGCVGRERCIAGQFACQYDTNMRRPCFELNDTCPQSTAACDAAGNSGPCQPAAPRPEDCNSCDDDLDGVADNAVGGGPGSLTKPCSNSLGICPGINQACEVRPINGGVWLANRWTACIAPAENCNGEDDNCNDAIDEGDICSIESTPACFQSPSHTSPSTFEILKP